MATKTYAITVDGHLVAEMTADFAQASSPILLDGESTPMQVADARHRPNNAAEMLLRWSYSQGAPLYEMNEDGDPVGDVAAVAIA